jgi:excisionase family DNA binding protein
MGKREYIVHQALAFIDYSNKRGAESFDSWARSKDFLESDKTAVYNQCLRMMAVESHMKQNNNFKFSYHHQTNLQEVTMAISNLTPANLGVKEAANYLGVSKRTLERRMTKTKEFGKVRYISIGRRVLFPKFELDRWLQEEAMHQWD